MAMDSVPVVTTLSKTMSVKEAASKLKNLRCDLRQMERAAKTLGKHHYRIWYPNAGKSLGGAGVDAVR